MEQARDAYINAYSQSCNFCGNQNDPHSEICILCEGDFCSNCIAYTTPEATFQGSNLTPGMYCYKCIDQIISQRQSVGNYDQVWNFTGSILSKLMSLASRIINKSFHSIPFLRKFNEKIKSVSIKSRFLSESFNSIKITLNSLSRKERAKLSFQLSSVVLLYSLFSNYILFPVMKFIAENSSLALASIFALLTIPLVDAWLVKKDSNGFYRRLSGSKKIPRYIFLILLMLVSPLFMGVFKLISATILKMLGLIFNMLGLDFFNDFLGGSKEFLNKFLRTIKIFWTSVTKSPFKLI